jgi:hypothetical protein
MRPKVLALALVLSGCVTSAQLQRAQAWSAEAHRACAKPGACPDSEKCTRAVIALASEGAGLADWERAMDACAPFGATP